MRMQLHVILGEGGETTTENQGSIHAKLYLYRLEEDS